jgi:hypothetical protein
VPTHGSFASAATLPEVQPSELWPHDQDHYGGLQPTKRSRNVEAGGNRGGSNAFVSHLSEQKISGRICMQVPVKARFGDNRNEISRDGRKSVAAVEVDRLLRLVSEGVFAD